MQTYRNKKKSVKILVFNLMNRQIKIIIHTIKNNGILIILKIGEFLIIISNKIQEFNKKIVTNNNGITIFKRIQDSPKITIKMIIKKCQNQNNLKTYKKKHGTMI